VAVGFFHAGKTTVLKDEKGLHLSSDDIHRRLDKTFATLRRDDCVGTYAYWARQIFATRVCRMVLDSVLQSGVRVICDSCNLRARDRRWILRRAKLYHYHTIIIYITCPEHVLLERLEETDRQRVRAGDPPVCVELYYKVQKSIFETPHESEADEFFVIPTV
jgi:predicted kinase